MSQAESPSGARSADEWDGRWGTRLNNFSVQPGLSVYLYTFSALYTLYMHEETPHGEVCVTADDFFPIHASSGSFAYPASLHWFCCCPPGKRFSLNVHVLLRCRSHSFCVTARRTENEFSATGGDGGNDGENDGGGGDGGGDGDGGGGSRRRRKYLSRLEFRCLLR